MTISAFRRSSAMAAALALLVLPNCEHEPLGVVASPMPTTTPPADLPASGRGPVELLRFGDAATAGKVSPGQATATIYPGSGVLYHPGPVRGTGVVTAGSGDISLDFVNTDIKEVAKGILGDLLGLNYVVDASVQGSITVQTSQPLAKSDILAAFETVLHVNGLALVRQGGFYTIVPFGSAGKTGGLGSRGDGYGTEIVALHFIGPEQMRRVLEPLAPQGSIVQVDQARNLMVIGGTEGERAAMREQLATFDVDWLRGMSFALFKPRIATSKQMVDDLNHLMGDESSGMAGQVRLVSIDRMNAVLAVSTQARYLEELKVWVSRLDQGNETSDRRIFVYYVQNGRAGDLAKVMGKALGIHGTDTSSSQSQSASPTSGSGMRSGPTTGGQFGQGPSSSGSLLQSQGMGQSQGLGQSGSISGGYPANANAPAQTAGGAGPGQAAGDQPGGLSITADDVNNALLIVATPSEFDIIESALSKLDILPLQVLIEASIAEVTLNDQMNFGIQWVFNNGTNQITSNGQSTPGIASAFPGFSYLYTSGTRISAVLNALGAITHVDVLSAPKLMVLNNQTATLEVGDQVPIATQSAVSTLTPDSAVVNSIEYKDTGVIMTVTPRVNAGGLVLMDISQEVSDVSSTTTSTLNSPTINERKISSTVAIQDGQTIALGGLILDNRSKGRSGVPVLEDIPYLGSVFRQDTDTKTRTELLVLITPRVVRDGRDAAAMTDDLRNQLMNLKEEFVANHLGPNANH